MNVFRQLKEYLDKATKEELEEDIKNLESYSKDGVSVKEYIDYVKKNFLKNK